MVSTCIPSVDDTLDPSGDRLYRLRFTLPGEAVFFVALSGHASPEEWAKSLVQLAARLDPSEAR